MERVSPAAGIEQPRLLHRPSPPDSHTSIWRFASASIACMTKRTELTFFTSQRVRNGSPGLRTDTFTSARMEPSSMLPSQVPR